MITTTQRNLLIFFIVFFLIGWSILRTSYSPFEVAVPALGYTILIGLFVVARKATYQKRTRIIAGIIFAFLTICGGLTVWATVESDPIKIDYDNGGEEFFNEHPELLNNCGTEPDPRDNIKFYEWYVCRDTIYLQNLEQDKYRWFIFQEYFELFYVGPFIIPLLILMGGIAINTP